jgi:tetratricopeptide (TPR) repeat protein
MRRHPLSVGRLSILLIGIILNSAGFGQSPSAKDSLRWQGELDSARNMVFSQPAEARALLDSIRPYVFVHEKLKLTWHNVCGIYYATRSELDSAARCFQYIIDRSDSNPAGKAGALHNLSIVRKTERKPLESLALIGEAEKLYRIMDDKKNIAVMYGSKASVYRDREQYALAADWLLKAINLLQQLPDDNKDLINTEKQKLANTYLMLQRYAEAAALYREVLPVFKENNNNFYYATTLLNYGNALYETRELDRASHVLDEAIALLSEFEHPDYIALGYFHKANLSRYAENPTAAEEAFRMAMEADRQGNRTYADEIYVAYLEWCVQQAEYDKARNAIRRIEKENILGKSGLKIRLNYALSRARLYEGKGQWQSGASAWKEAFHYQDTLYNTLQEQTASETQARLALEEMTGEKNQLIMELEGAQHALKQQKGWMLGIGLFLLFAFAGQLFWQKRRYGST